VVVLLYVGKGTPYTSATSAPCTVTPTVVWRVTKGEKGTFARMEKPPHRSPFGPVLFRASMVPWPPLMSKADGDRSATGCENLQPISKQSVTRKWPSLQWPAQTTVYAPVQVDVSTAPAPAPRPCCINSPCPCSQPSLYQQPLPLPPALDASTAPAPAPYCINSPCLLLHQQPLTLALPHIASTAPAPTHGDMTLSPAAVQTAAISDAGITDRPVRLPSVKKVGMVRGIKTRSG